MSVLHFELGSKPWSLEAGSFLEVVSSDSRVWLVCRVRPMGVELSNLLELFLEQPFLWDGALNWGVVLNHLLYLGGKILFHFLVVVEVILSHQSECRQGTTLSKHNGVPWKGSSLHKEWQGFVPPNLLEIQLELGRMEPRGVRPWNLEVRRMDPRC